MCAAPRTIALRRIRVLLRVVRGRSMPRCWTYLTSTSTVRVGVGVDVPAKISNWPFAADDPYDALLAIDVRAAAGGRCSRGLGCTRRVAVVVGLWLRVALCHAVAPAAASTAASTSGLGVGGAAAAGCCDRRG